MAKHIKTVRGLKICRRRHKAMKRLLDNGDYPAIHGHKVWFSSYLVMDYLLDNPPPKKARVMEIGCGWGLLGIFCAKEFKAKVMAVDADRHVFPFLKLHAKLNQVKIKTRVRRFHKIKDGPLAMTDLMVCADVCFWKELVKPLRQLIKRALDNGVQRIIIADPGRSPFLKLAKFCGKKYGAELLPMELDEPRKKSGYLLLINADY